MVMPRCRSSGALSMESKARKSAPPCSDRYLVIAAVRVVLPWSTCPIVPTFTCGLLRSNFCLAMVIPSLLLRVRWLTLGLCDQLGGQRGRNFGVVGKLHRIGGAALGHAAQLGGIAEHLRQRDEG